MDRQQNHDTTTGRVTHIYASTTTPHKTGSKCARHAPVADPATMRPRVPSETTRIARKHHPGLK